MVELNKENFEEEVLNYTSKPVFVDFWGDKCEICKELMPDVHKLEDRYMGILKFASLNISSARRVAIAQKVLGLPTMIIYKNGQKVSVLTPDKINNIKDVEEFIRKSTEDEYKESAVTVQL